VPHSSLSLPKFSREANFSFLRSERAVSCLFLSCFVTFASCRVGLREDSVIGLRSKDQPLPHPSLVAHHQSTSLGIDKCSARNLSTSFVLIVFGIPSPVLYSSRTLRTLSVFHRQWSTQIRRALLRYSPCNRFVGKQVSSLEVTKLSVGACAFRLKDLIFLVVAYRSPGRPADVSRRYLPLLSSYLSYSTSDVCFMEAPFRWSFLEESSSSAEKWRSVILIVLDRSSFWSVYC